MSDKIPIFDLGGNQVGWLGPAASYLGPIGCVLVILFLPIAFFVFPQWICIKTLLKLIKGEKLVDTLDWAGIAVGIVDVAFLILCPLFYGSLFGLVLLFSQLFH